MAYISEHSTLASALSIYPYDDSSEPFALNKLGAKYQYFYVVSIYTSERLKKHDSRR